MAKAQSSGGMGAALVVMGAAFVVSLILAILFFTQVGKANESAEQAEAKYDEVASSQDERNPAFTAAKDDPDHRTVVGSLLAQVTTLQDTLEARNTEAANAENQLRAKDSEISSLQQQFTNARSAKEQAERRLSQAERQFEDQIASLNARVKTADAKAGQAESQFSNAISSATSEVTEVRGSLSEQLAQARNNLGDAQSEVQRLTDENDRLQRQLADVNPNPQTTPADGQIAAVLSGSDQVYLNLGSNDNLLKGMTFEVFNPNRAISLDSDEDESLRGKATIEVFAVSDESSIARIVRLERNADVLEGDQIANLVYSPEAEYLFYVFGQFDIEGLGDPTTNDLSKLRALVGQWGGELVPEIDAETNEPPTLDFTVDYLVLGTEPVFPNELDDSVIDPDRIAERARQLKAYNTYQALKRSAQSLGIPVLNQNRFLYLVGYYQR